ncbi:MAG: formylglycine-generating enzyme family protein [Planctomycetes bacterium]|nr:formylglycine-generating enzyme family protein [Planctomycetota bacterium]
MRFFITVLLLIGVVIALFYFVILPIITTDNPEDTTNVPKPPVKPNNIPNETDGPQTEPDNGKPLNGNPTNETANGNSNGNAYIDPSCEELKIPELGPEMREFEKNYPEKWRNPTDESEMLLVRAGTFIRGSNMDRNRGVEKPEMKIYVSSFYVDNYPITYKQFRKFINDDGYKKPKFWSEEGWLFKKSGKLTKPAFWDENMDNDNPVVGVSWFEAEAYCRWSGKKLLSEVEWEKAARGYYGKKYPWGDKWVDESCNWKDIDPNSSFGFDKGFIDGFAKLAPVYQYKKYKSPFGAYQMSGNVWEWVLDYWNTDFFKKTVANDKKLRKDPLNSDKNESRPFRVIKGGSYGTGKDFCEPSWRNGNHPERRASTYGFRCGKRADLVYDEYLKSLVPEDSPDDSDN